MWIQRIILLKKTEFQRTTYFCQQCSFQKEINYFKYGIPEKAKFKFNISDREEQIIRGSQKNGRKHDVTLYIVKDGKPILLDINKTIGATGLINKKENDKKRKHLSEGINSYFDKIQSK